MSKKKVQDAKILLRLSTSLSDAMDQTIKEQLPQSNKSEFIRRAIRFTIDNIEAFKESESATVEETEEIESIAKTNAVRELHDQLFKYKEKLLKEPQTPLSVKQMSFLIYLIGEMIFKMNEE